MVNQRMMDMKYAQMKVYIRNDKYISVRNDKYIRILLLALCSIHNGHVMLKYSYMSICYTILDE